MRAENALPNHCFDHASSGFGYQKVNGNLFLEVMNDSYLAYSLLNVVGKESDQKLTFCIIKSLLMLTDTSFHHMISHLKSHIHFDSQVCLASRFFKNNKLKCVFRFFLKFGIYDIPYNNNHLDSLIFYCHMIFTC